MDYRIEDLGVAAYGDTYLGFRTVVHPETGEEYAALVLAPKGFVLVDPRSHMSRQILPPEDLNTMWSFEQGSDGTVLQVGQRKGYNALLGWRWDGETSRVAAELPPELPESFIFGVYAAADGRIYIYTLNPTAMHCFDPKTGKTTPFPGGVPQPFACSRDGFLYSARQGTIVTLDAETGAARDVLDSDGKPCRGQLIKDAGGRVLAASMKYDRQHYRELVSGRPRRIESADVQLCRATTGVNAVNATTSDVQPLAFRGGGYVSRVVGDEVTCVDADGSAHTIEATRQKFPLGIWCVASGGGKVWCGTVFPPALASYDPEAASFTDYGAPTETNGEIYSMVFSKGKLYMASYVRATLTRFAPDRPWKLDRSPSANPACLGFMKDGSKFLHRPRGRTSDQAGNVYFSAAGSYGTEDSGICRINPDTEDVERWIYPNTEMNAICHLPNLDQLVVSDSRQGEDALRFTFISPHTGEVLRDDVVISDNGDVISWLHDGGDLLYGMHAYRATLFAYSLSQHRIVAKLVEMPYGGHCYNCLVFGPDDRIWGLTERCVYAARRDLSSSEIVAEYEQGQGFYRFGMVYGPDGNLYFPNGPHLMRLKCR